MAIVRGGECAIEPHPYTPPDDDTDYPFDMTEIKGQEWVKEALVIAAAGSHNMLMVGPPGSGKTVSPGEHLTLCLPGAAMNS